MSAAAFEFEIVDGLTRTQWLERFAHVLATDPAGSWVAEQGGEPVGVAQAMIREQLWVLSLLTVSPTAQSSGAGRRLLERTLAYGEGLDGLIISSNDPRAMRLYAAAGFALLPTVESVGRPSRSLLRRPGMPVREVGDSGLELAAAISREVRGAAHTTELELVLRQGALLYVAGDRGYAVARPGHAVWLLAARDDEAAQALLWHALGELPEAEPPNVRWVTGDQGWAIDVLVRAGLGLRAFGAVAVRGVPGPLRPFLPSPPFA